METRYLYTLALLIKFKQPADFSLSNSQNKKILKDFTRAVKKYFWISFSCPNSNPDQIWSIYSEFGATLLSLNSPILFHSEENKTVGASHEPTRWNSDFKCGQKEAPRSGMTAKSEIFWRIGSSAEYWIFKEIMFAT